VSAKPRSYPSRRPADRLDLWPAVGEPCDAAHVEVTDADLARIPTANLRVPRAEFGAVWATAEQRCVELSEQGIIDDWYAAGVAVACRWLADAVVEDGRGRRGLAYSPVTGREARAFEE
jgi:hypothetical protein